MFKTISIAESSPASSSSSPSAGSVFASSATAAAAGASASGASAAAKILDKLIEVKISELKRGTKYGVIVQAFNSKGPGPQSDEIVSETLTADPPNPPAHLSVTSVSFMSVTLTWDNSSNASPDDGSSTTNVQALYPSGGTGMPITGYHLLFKSSRSGSVWEEKVISVSEVIHLHSPSHQHQSVTSSYTLGGLLCATYYQVR